jgi:hypothetical protein
MTRAEKSADAFRYMQMMRPTKSELDEFTPKEMQGLSAGIDGAVKLLESMQADIAARNTAPATPPTAKPTAQDATTGTKMVSRAGFESMDHKARHSFVTGGGKITEI